MTQKIIRIVDGYDELYGFLRERSYKNIMLVTDGSFNVLPCKSDIQKIGDICGCRLVVFNDILPNPTVDSVISGIEIFNKNNCDAVLAVGGGSAIDVAKCIKLYLNSNLDQPFPAIKPKANNIDLTVLPTTAGTGSEATRYSVVYYNGEKQSVTNDGIVPCCVVFDERVLYSLPDYQKRCTLCDAFFHAVESYWSVNSTEDSKAIAEDVIKTVLSVYRAYLDGDKSVCAVMQNAAYRAGRAINVTQTTAGHAMSYKLTSLFNIAHGHAVALCAIGIFDHAVTHIDRCVDPRGKAYLKETLGDLSRLLGGNDMAELPTRINDFVNDMSFTVPDATPEQIDILAKSINPVRLKNNPVKIDETDAKNIYTKILGEK